MVSATCFKEPAQTKIHIPRRYLSLHVVWFGPDQTGACSNHMSPNELPARKKRRLEELKESATMNKLLDLVGRGQISVTSASEIAGCVAPFSWFKMFF